MNRERFGQLLQKYSRGACTPEEKAFVEHWYGLLENETGEAGQEPDMAELENKLWNQIQAKMDTEPTNEGKVIPFRTVQYRWMGVAASLLLIGWWFFARRPAITVAPEGVTPALSRLDLTEQTNPSEKAKMVRLEDGSAVTLAAHSSIKFPKHFSPSERTVYLTGDAFFDIQKMPSRPFYVHTGRVITKVLGTSFFVRTQANTKQIRVEVVTGRVAVYEETLPKQKATNGVVLSPNQAATFFGEEQHFVTGLVDKPVVIQKQETSEKQSISFQFDDAPLSTVLARLEQAYGIAIEVENESQKACPLTADLTNQPLYTQLDIICAALKSTYKVQGTTILISGKGCE